MTDDTIKSAALDLMRVVDERGFEAAALDVLYSHRNRFSELDAKWGQVTLEALSKERVRLAELRAWAGSIKDKKVRKAYLRWIDYFDYQTDRAEHELRTGEWRKQSEKFEAERREKNAARRAVKAVHDFPSPPQR